MNFLLMMTWHLSSLAYFLVAKNDTVVYTVSHKPFNFLVSGRYGAYSRYRALHVAVGQLPRSWFCLVSFENVMCTHVSSSYNWGNDKCKILPRPQYAWRCWLLFRSLLLLVLDVVWALHCCIQETTNGKQKDLPSRTVYWMPTVCWAQE